jgi:hypothetical protein
MSRLVNSRLEDAAISAFAVGCAYVFVSSLVMLFLPDAGRGSPNNLVVAGGVFAVAFLVSAARATRVEGTARPVVVERDVTAVVVAGQPLADTLATTAPSSRASAATTGDAGPRVP